MEGFYEILKSQGVLGVVAIGMGVFINMLHQDHKKERKEMLEALIQVAENNRKTTEANTSIISELKGVLESIDRRVSK